MITSQNLKRHELIGLWTEVASARNQACVGLRGKIVDETQKTLVLLADSAFKHVFKHGSKFKVTLPDETVAELDGDEITARPWERIAK